MEVVAGGLKAPWAIAFAPDGRILLTERPERLRVIQHGQLCDIIEAPDGTLSLLTNNRDGRGSPAPDDDKILRIVRAT